jgi:hypothetical protein
MNCQSCRNEIEELEMGGSLSKAASAHLDTCSPCGAFYNERLSLRRLVGSLEPVSAPPDFEFRLRARLAASSDSGNHLFSLRSFIASIASARAIGLAASFVLLLAGVAVYNHFKSGPAATTQPSMAADRNSAREPETGTKNSPAIMPASESSPQSASIQKEEKLAPPATLPAGSNSPHPSLAVNNRNGIRQPRKLDAGGAQIITNDIGSRSAPKITPAGESPSVVTAKPLLELTVRSSSQPMRVLVNDRIGGKRSVTLEPVIFGSQDFTGRNGQRLPASQGIW